MAEASRYALQADLPQTEDLYAFSMSDRRSSPGVEFEQTRQLAGETISTSSGGFSTETVITSSKDCTRQCLDENRVFCRGQYKLDSGVCCDRDDNNCLSQNEYDLCSIDFDQS